MDRNKCVVVCKRKEYSAVEDETWRWKWTKAVRILRWIRRKKPSRQVS